MSFPLKVSVSVMQRRSQDIFRPDETIELIVDALPSTTVGLLAVDKAVYLLRDYHRLTKDKVTTGAGLCMHFISSLELYLH